MSIKDKCGRFVEILLGSKFLHSCKGGGSFSNLGGSNRVPPHYSTDFGVCLESRNDWRNTDHLLRCKGCSTKIKNYLVEKPTERREKTLHNEMFLIRCGTSEVGGLQISQPPGVCKKLPPRKTRMIRTLVNGSYLFKSTQA